MARELASYVVALEAAMRADSPSDDPLDTPALGVLLALDLFGPLRPNAIAQLLAMSTGTTSKRLDRLEVAGLIARRLGAVPGDRRGVVIELSAAGRREIDRTERVAVGLGAELLRVLRPLVGPDTPVAAADGPAPVLTALFRFVSLLDQSALRAVGDRELLHPTDPRPLLLLGELDHSGPRAPGSIPALIDRSRSATHRLVTRMAAEGLVATGTSPAGGRPAVRLRPRGRRAWRAVVTALAEDLPAVRPAATDLAAALTAATAATERTTGRR